MTSLLPVPFERCEWPPVPAQSGCASSGPRTSLCGCHGAAPGQTGPEAGLNCTHLTQCRFLAWAPGSVGAALAEPRPPPSYAPARPGEGSGRTTYLPAALGHSGLECVPSAQESLGLLVIYALHRLGAS